MPAKLLRQVLNEGLALALVGLAIGVFASLASAHLLRSLLFRVSPLDPATYALASAVLPGAAVLACWLPARRAAREDPMTVLRVE